MDPWAITPAERVKHEEQFRSLAPGPNMMISGGQARGFMMQSGLAPMVLAQVWGLADLNGDGQMDVNEFSIACKLITNQLKGFPLPKTLPPSLLVVNHLALQPHHPSLIQQQQQQHHPMMAQPAPMSGMAMMPGAVMMMGQQQAMMLPQQQPPPPPMTNEWAVPMPTRAKYQALFSNTDRNRTGFLAGVQARNLLLQSGLPQNVLATIWSLSDVDGDGRLSMEEFILAGHLCELSLKGEPLPQPGHLPPTLVPPSLRSSTKQQQQQQHTPNAATPGSSSGKEDVATTPSTFEDKRRENFNKGQAELQRRRQSLLDQQRKEEEERKRKEKEEAEAREKQKQEMERQRMEEWEKQRKAELIQHRQREQEKVLTLKARQEHLNSSLESMRDKVGKLMGDISDCRGGVTDVKCFIDGMRTSRDAKMKEMTELKAKLRDQNQRLLLVTQEKAKLESKNRARQVKIDGGAGTSVELTDFDIKKQDKEKRVKELREKHQDMKNKENETRQKFEAEKKAMEDHRQKLRNMIETCKLLHNEFDEKRREVKAEKAKRIRELTDPTYAWDNPEEAKHPTVAVLADEEAEALEYRAIYDFESSNADELPFKSGDVILVRSAQNPEPGWLGGELNGRVGWFPEAYVERVDEAATAALQPIAEEESEAATDTARVLFDWKGDPSVPTEIPSLTKGQIVKVESRDDPNWWLGVVLDGTVRGYFPANHVTLKAPEPRGSTPLEAPEPVGVSPQKKEVDDDSKMCVSLFAYHSEEPGDLTFEAGETITIMKKEAEWWTGRIGSRKGVFPFNYVQSVSIEAATKDPPAAATTTTAEGDVDKGHHQYDVPPPANDDEGEEEHAEPTRTEGTESEYEGGGKGSSKKPEIATVVAPYTATSKEQLSLQRGQMILIRKKTSSGWWQGEVQASGVGTGKKRQLGWFPATYVKLLEPSGDRRDAAAATVSSSERKKRFRALFSYAGRHEDELSFEVGDAIVLISKDEELWWKGEVNGRSGVFPSNYVEEEEEEEK